MVTLICAAAGDSIAGAISADVETAAAARAVKTVCFNMTCLLVGNAAPKDRFRTKNYGLGPVHVPCRKRVFGPPPRPDFATIYGTRRAQTKLDWDLTQSAHGLPGSWESAIPAAFRDRRTIWTRSPTGTARGTRATPRSW